MPRPIDRLDQPRDTDTPQNAVARFNHVVKDMGKQPPVIAASALVLGGIAVGLIQRK